MKSHPDNISTALPYSSLASATAVPYIASMQAVVETKAYISAAKDAGMSEDEMQAVFLLTVFGKNEKANLSGAERNVLAALTKTLRDSF